MRVLEVRRRPPRRVVAGDPQHRPRVGGAPTLPRSGVRAAPPPGGGCNERPATSHRPRVALRIVEPTLTNRERAGWASAPPTPGLAVRAEVGRAYASEPDTSALALGF